MKQDKDYALPNYKKMIMESWSYKKMTQEEQRRIMKVFDWANEVGVLAGSYDTRWNILNGLYHAFIEGIGGCLVLDERYKH